MKILQFIALALVSLPGALSAIAAEDPPVGTSPSSMPSGVPPATPVTKSHGPRISTRMNREGSPGEASPARRKMPPAGTAATGGTSASPGGAPAPNFPFGPSAD